MVERDAAEVLLDHLAGTAAGDTVHFGGAHIADSEDTADDSHCISGSEEPGTAAAIEQPWRSIDVLYKWVIELIDKSRSQKKLVMQ